MGSNSRIRKIGYKIDGDRLLDDHDDCPRVKSRRLDLENCHFVDLVSVTLRLNSPAILYYIRLGKFCHQRVNRIRLKNNNGILLFDIKVLSNDTIPKEYKLLRTHDGEDIVSYELYFEYKKRVDVWSGMSTIISFDAVDLEFFGIDDSEVIRPAQEKLRLSRERWAWDLCFSHLIRFGHADIVSVLERRMGIRHIHPTIDTLCRLLYFKADYQEVENTIRKAEKCGNFDEYAKRINEKIIWNRCFDLSMLAPPERINPQMCIDEKKQLVYLFGGASSASNRNDRVLDDFWCFDVKKNQWRSISASTTNENGPCGRTKATMYFHAEKETIYICGGSGQNFKVLDDLYQYNATKNVWKKLTNRICSNCDLIHTYAFCFGKNVDFSIYCFPWNQSPHFKHFKLNSDKLKLDKSIFIFNISTHERRCLLLDETGITYSYATFNAKNNSFYLIGKETSGTMNLASCYKCLYEFNLRTEKCQFVSDLPFTGRINCNVDEETGDLYVCAFSEPSTSHSNTWTNQFWKFCASERKWYCCGGLEIPDLLPINLVSTSTDTTTTIKTTTTKPKFSNLKTVRVFDSDLEELSPMPRRAASFAFDSSRKVFYMFGGILSNEITNTPSLNELYIGRLIKINTNSILRRCVWHIRTNYFIDALITSKNWQIKTLAILQQLNADFPELKYKGQTNRLAQLIFQRETILAKEKGSNERDHRMHKLFSFLCKHFPKSIQPPKENLLNIVNQIVASSSSHISTSSTSNTLLPQTLTTNSLSSPFLYENYTSRSGGASTSGSSLNNSQHHPKRRSSYFD